MADQQERNNPHHDDVDTIEANEEGSLLGGIAPFTRDTEGVVAGPPSGQAGGVVANNLVDTDGGIARPSTDSADSPDTFAGGGATDVSEGGDNPTKSSW
jgi:hypothetical protein